MIDGFKIFIPNVLLKDLNMKHLVRIGENTYIMKNTSATYNPKKLTFKLIESGMTIEGSLMYAMNDNGIQFNTRLEQELYLGAIGAIIQVDIMQAEVKYFEAGTVVNTPFKFQDFSANHVGVPEMDLSMCNKNIKIFGDGVRSVKIYDAGYNAKKKVSADIRKGLIKRGIFDPKGNYIKYEVKYQKPNVHFKKSVIHLKELFDPSFSSVINTDIVDTYTSMTKTGVKIDSSITTLSTEDILFITLKKLEAEIGTIDIQKKLLETLHEHRKFYTASQKCYRKKTITKMASAFKSDPNSTDISALIIKQLTT